jgi:hypothetical protein
MTRAISKLLLSVAVFGLMACGGSGGGNPLTSNPEPVENEGEDDAGGDDTTPPVGVTGTNGLDFGADGQSLTDVETIAVTSRYVEFINGSDASLTNAIVTLDAGFLNASATDRSGTVEVAGETVAITNGSSTLSTGETVIATFEPDRAGTYSGVLDVSIVGTSNGAIAGEGAFVLGFETAPDVIADQPVGNLEYTGGFQAFGSLNGDDDTSTEYEGDMTVLVDFANAGTADVTLNGQLNGTTEADLGGTLAISGNGFSGDLTCTAGCTDDGSSINAGFYGPDADEVSGVLGLGFTAGGDEFDGAGSFVLTDRVAR